MDEIGLKDIDNQMDEIGLMACKLDDDFMLPWEISLKNMKQCLEISKIDWWQKEVKNAPSNLCIRGWMLVWCWGSKERFSCEYETGQTKGNNSLE